MVYIYRLSYIQGIIACHIHLQYIRIDHIYRVSMLHAPLSNPVLLLRCHCSAAASSFCEFYRL